MKDSPHPGDSLTIALRERLAAIADDVKFPVRLSVDETEGVRRAHG
jgi:hypothetical protein